MSPVSKAQPAWGGQHAQPGPPPPLVAPFPPPPGQEVSPAASVARSPASEAPSVSVAPWAKEVDTHATKSTPSLKEIQEIEAKAAAAREAADAQVRRELLSHQLSNAPPPPAPGLPSTATWATSPSTTPSAGGISAWNKPLAKAAPVSTGRKTLQQIQKEEEARKAKAAAAAASQAALTSSSAVISAAGKRYADLASKAAAATQAPMVNSAWTTVGPGGKSKGGPLIPVAGTTSPAPTQTLRTSTSAVGFSGAIVKKPATPVSTPKPVATSAQEEFLKWCRASMKGLNSGVSRKEPQTPT